MVYIGAAVVRGDIESVGQQTSHDSASPAQRRHHVSSVRCRDDQRPAAQYSHRPHDCQSQTDVVASVSPGASSSRRSQCQQLACASQSTKQDYIRLRQQRQAPQQMQYSMTITISPTFGQQT